MNKSKLAICIICLCVLSLFVGIFSSLNSSKNNVKNEQKANNTITSTLQKNKILLLKFNGVISSADEKSYFSTATSAQDLVEALDSALKDDSTKGVLIKLNTPGGTVGMSQNIYDAIIRVRKVKPVVISMEDVSASGGYYISAAADRIFAQRGTMTGSIGVIFSTMDIHELLTEKLLIKSNVIKSGKYKDVGSQLRPMSDEEKELLQGIIDDSYNQFLNDITKGRITPYIANNQKDKNGFYNYTSVPSSKLSTETLKKYADGRVFTGSQAYALGFVDGLGDLETAHEAIVKMAKERFHISDKNIPLVQYNKYQSFSEYILNSVNSISGKNLSSEIADYVPNSMKMAKQPLYLWE